MPEAVSKVYLLRDLLASNSSQAKEINKLSSALIAMRYIEFFSNV